MKFPRIYIFLFTIIVISSCSKDTPVENLDAEQQENPADENKPESEEEELETETKPGNDTITAEDSFSFSLDGEEVIVTEWLGQRSENTIAINGWNEAGNNIQLQFNAFGNLSGVSSFSSEFEYPTSYSYEYFKSEYFDFQLVNVDEVNKKVEVTFEGVLYEDERDLDSEQHAVKGSFIVTYADVEPVIAGLGTYAKINGEHWYSTDSESTGGFVSGTDITLVNFNDGEYALYLTFNHDMTEEGIYEFSEDDFTNTIFIGKYEKDLEGDSFVGYNTSGTLTITEKTAGFIPTITGTFSFTATHPENGDVIEVTNGSFLEVYQAY